MRMLSKRKSVLFLETAINNILLLDAILLNIIESANFIIMKDKCLEII